VRAALEQEAAALRAENAELRLRFGKPETEERGEESAAVEAASAAANASTDRVL
jgi:regulator of replication initiation timing